MSLYAIHIIKPLVIICIVTQKHIKWWWWWCVFVYISIDIFILCIALCFLQSGMCALFPVTNSVIWRSAIAMRYSTFDFASHLKKKKRKETYTLVKTTRVASMCVFFSWLSNTYISSKRWWYDGYDSIFTSRVLITVYCVSKNIWSGSKKVTLCAAGDRLSSISIWSKIHCNVSISVHRLSL